LPCNFLWPIPYTRKWLMGWSLWRSTSRVSSQSYLSDHRIFGSSEYSIRTSQMAMATLSRRLNSNVHRQRQYYKGGHLEIQHRWSC
jgi:hypothetical protein